MATYIILNCIVLAVLLITLRWRKLLLWNRSVLVTLGILLATTAIFDSLIIAYGIVAYDESKLLSLYIWQAPIEDFFYALAVGLLIPALWAYFGRSINGNS